METVSTGQAFSRFSGRLWRGFLGMFFSLLFPSVLHFLSPGAWAWPKPMVPGFRTQWSSGSWCLIGKNSVRIQQQVRGGFVWIQRDRTPRVWAIRGEWPWNVMWLFGGWVISYANEWEDHSNNWGTTHSSVVGQCLGTVLMPLGVSFILQIEEQGLVELDLSSWTPFDINRFTLCPWAMSFFQKLCPAPFPPVSYSSPVPCPGPQSCFYNLLEGQSENSWPLG